MRAMRASRPAAPDAGRSSRAAPMRECRGSRGLSQTSAAAVSVGPGGGPGGKTSPSAWCQWAGLVHQMIDARCGPVLGRWSGLHCPPGGAGWGGWFVLHLCPQCLLWTQLRRSEIQRSRLVPPWAPHLCPTFICLLVVCLPTPTPHPLTLDQGDRLWSGDICRWTCGTL